MSRDRELVGKAQTVQAKRDMYCGSSSACCSFLSYCFTVLKDILIADLQS